MKNICRLKIIRIWFECHRGIFSHILYYRRQMYAPRIVLVYVNQTYVWFRKLNVDPSGTVFSGDPMWDRAEVEKQSKSSLWQILSRQVFSTDRRKGESMFSFQPKIQLLCSFQAVWLGHFLSHWETLIKLTWFIWRVVWKTLNICLLSSDSLCKDAFQQSGLQNSWCQLARFYAGCIFAERNKYDRWVIFFLNYLVFN